MKINLGNIGKFLKKTDIDADILIETLDISVSDMKPKDKLILKVLWEVDSLYEYSIKELYNNFFEGIKFEDIEFESAGEFGSHILKIKKMSILKTKNKIGALGKERSIEFTEFGRKIMKKII